MLRRITDMRKKYIKPEVKGVLTMANWAPLMTSRVVQKTSFRDTKVFEDMEYGGDTSDGTLLFSRKDDFDWGDDGDE